MRLPTRRPEGRCSAVLPAGAAGRGEHVGGPLLFRGQAQPCTTFRGGAGPCFCPARRIPAFGVSRVFLRRSREGKAALQLFPLFKARARAAREHGRLSDKAGRGRRIAANPHHAPEDVHFRFAAARPPAARAALSFVGKNGVHRHGESLWEQSI